MIQPICSSSVYPYPTQLGSKQTATSAPSPTPDPAAEVNQLIADLNSGDPAAQSNAARSLGELAQSNISAELKAQMVAPLITALNSTNAGVQTNAASALGILAESNIPSGLKAEMIDPLLAALTDNDASVRSNAAHALWALAGSNILVRHKVTLVAPLLQALQDGDYTVRVNAIGGLSELALSDIPTDLKISMVNPLIAALGDPNPSVRSNAAAALRILARNHISLTGNSNGEEISAERGTGGRGFYDLGVQFFRDGNYQNAANVLAQTSEADAIFSPILAQISQSLAAAPEAYEIQEVTLSGGLKTRSFRRIDGTEADVHVFYNDDSITTVMSGETKLEWQDGNNNDHSFTLGTDSRNLNANRIDLETIYQGTFGSVTFENVAETLGTNNLLLEFSREREGNLPRQIFDGLKFTLVSTQTAQQLDFNGGYQRSPEKITLSLQADKDTIIHELIHHWDLWVTQEGRSDLSRIFYGISWDGQSATRLDDDLADFRGSNFNSCESDSCSAGPAGSQINLNTDRHPYGMENEREDLATFGEEFFVRGSALRRSVREQMALGNFEPAVKYLFVKYFVFHGNEYGMTNESEALNYDEIMENIDGFGAENVRVGTRRALSDIQRLRPSD